MTISSIGTGQTYTTIATWLAACPSNLVTAGSPWIGELANQEFDLGSSTITITGITTDSTHYIELRAQAGASFADTSSNPLRYGTSGARVKCNGYNASVFAINGGQNNVFFTRIQILNTGTGPAIGSGYGSSGSAIARQCILQAGTTSVNGAVYSIGGHFEQCAIINTAASAATIAYAGGGINFYGCTLVGNGAAVAFTGNYGSSTLENCAIYGCTALSAGSTARVYTNCKTDISTGLPSGITTAALSTSAGAKFVNIGIGSGTQDYKITSGSAFTGAGVADSTYSPIDIFGSTRPNPPTVGAYELPVSATAITLTGPTSGTVSVASTNFTVGANGGITGTVVVTPSDGGAGGTFTPTTVSISSGSPTGTFTYTPASTGAKTISVTNNGSLTNPSNITYTSNSGAATAVTMTGPTSGTVGVASTNFTVGANGAITGTVVVTPSDGGAGGTFVPTTVSISSGSPTGTFTYTPSSVGAKAISATNNGSLTNPSTITYTASSGAATTVTLTGPTSGNIATASTNFTVGANGVITGTVVVTPSDGGGGGTFAPTTVSINTGSPAGTFVYTPGTSGTKTISVTNNGGLTNPTNISYAVTGATLTSSAFKNNTGSVWATTTVPKVVVLKLSDMSTTLNLTSQTTNSSGIMTITSASLVAGTTYLLVCSDAGPTNFGCEAFVAA